MRLPERETQVPWLHQRDGNGDRLLHSGMRLARSQIAIDFCYRDKRLLFASSVPAGSGKGREGLG